MSLVPRILLALLSLAAPNLIRAAAAEPDIRSVLDKQAAAWNRGDLSEFVTTYAEDCVFVGTPPVRGRDRVLERYRSKYPDKSTMGQLAFANLEIKQIDTHSATVLGNFHLDRALAAGGPAAGVFSLVLQEREGHWLIVLDHTS